MRRSRTLSNTREVDHHPPNQHPPPQHQHQQQQPDEEQQQQQYDENNDTNNENDNNDLLSMDEGAAIVRNIASFLTLSDAASMASIVLDVENVNHHHIMMNISESSQQQHDDNNNHHQHPNRRRNNSVGGGGVGGSGGSGDHIIDSSWAVGEEIDPYHSASASASLETGYWVDADDDDDDNNLETPLTPALVALSPGATPHHSASHHKHHHHHHHRHHVYEADHAAGLFYGNSANMDTANPSSTVEKKACGSPMEQDDSFESSDDIDDDNDNDNTSSSNSPYGMQEILIARRRKWAQEKLAAAVYSHPGSLRSFCLQAYQAAQEIKAQQAAQALLEQEEYGTSATRMLSSTTTCAGAIGQYGRKMPRKLLRQLMDLVLHNMPLTLLVDVLEAVGETYVESIFASFRLCQKSLNAVVSALGHMIARVWDAIYNFNPFQLLEVIVSLQFNAMGRTSEVLVGGIQSVATGVGSASSLALHRLSAANLSVSLSANRSMSSASLLGDGSLRGNYRNHNYNGHHHHRSATSNQLVLNKKLLKKLSSINDAARVVKYTEMGDDTGGLTKQARTKVQRMMHYDVSLRPFVATVEKRQSASSSAAASILPARSLEQPHLKNSNDSSSSLMDGHSIEGGGGGDGGHSSPSNCTVGTTGSPFMCSPQSFPPTPHSRATLIARGNKFSDDIVFLARDQLRLHGNLASDNEKTREMSKLLREGKRLAVFNAKDAANGIDFSCGQHIARKAGNMLYCSTRSMVPVLRNCFVYFEITVLPQSVGGGGGGGGNMNIVLQQPSHMTTLSIGLSTSEMPPNTLVGAWQGSVGLCTTGQLLTAGQWCAPCANPSLCAYGDSATVGCLVCLDDGSAVDTWEGLLVTALVTFNVNGVIVAPPVANLPIPGAAAALPPTVVTSHHHLHARHGHHGITGVASAHPTNHYSNSTAGNTPPAAAKTAISPTSSSPCHSPTLHHRTTLPVLVPAVEELYPTVTLHSPTTAVMCRFSAEDIVAESRLTIGAPEGVTVYAVDGSVLFGGGADSS